jgi:hypothetical protein
LEDDDMLEIDGRLVYQGSFGRVELSLWKNGTLVPRGLARWRIAAFTRRLNELDQDIAGYVQRSPGSSITAVRGTQYHDKQLEAAVLLDCDAAAAGLLALLIAICATSRRDGISHLWEFLRYSERLAIGERSDSAH